MADMPVVCLFGHSFVKRLCNWSGCRGELVVETLGLQDFSQVVAYGQGGLSFKRVLASLDRYMCEIGRCHPDLLVVDLGTNDLAGTDCTVSDVVNRALRFLALVDNEVHPNMILVLSVVQRTCMGNRCDMSLSQFNHRVKSYNSRLAACVRQLSNVRMIAQSRLNFPRYISGDGCHLTEEGQCRYARGLRQALLKFLRLC